MSKSFEDWLNKNATPAEYEVGAPCPPCPRCNGQGYIEGSYHDETMPIECRPCEGTGVIEPLDSVAYLYDGKFYDRDHLAYIFKNQ